MKNTKPKIALLSICLNEQYWPYAQRLYETVAENLLKGHEIDKYIWSDMPEAHSFGATVFETEPATWPLPTLMRYHLFLREEETLAKYDYLLYIDIDMVIVGEVGDEILPKKGLIAAIHPMYTNKKGFEYAPFEPNPESAAYIDEKEFWKNPTAYYAGGFQGGTAKAFIKAMKVLKKNTDTDFNNNYVARWNDESHWNKLCHDVMKPEVVLDPSYIYPDSLIEEYYNPIWPENHGYTPKIMTITKPFTLSKAGGDAVQEHVKKLQNG
jgi:hypothetical protein